MASPDANPLVALGFLKSARMTSRACVLWESGRGEPIAARIAVAGDFLPAGKVALPTGGWREAARTVATVFAGVDVTFLNLECALESADLPPRPLNGLGQVVSGPSESLDYFCGLRCVVAGLANNHTYDFGPAGFDRTREALRLRGMVAVGVTDSRRAEPDAFVWRGPGEIRVGFWAAARASRDLATRSRAGVEPGTIQRARQAYKRLLSQGVNCSVALLHCGCIGTNRPDPSDARLMAGIANCGFQIVAASHSHRISGAQRISSGRNVPSFCFYGLGGIVSGYTASAIEREGLVIVAELHADGAVATVEAHPIVLTQSGFAEVPSVAEADLVLHRFRSLSDEVAKGASARLFYDDLSRGFARLYLRDASAAFRTSGFRGLLRKARRLRMRHIRCALQGVFG